MTYCIGIKTNGGVVLASDSRTNAGLDMSIFTQKCLPMMWAIELLLLLLLEI